LTVLGGTLAGGLMLGFVFAFFREFFDHVFRTGSQVENLLKRNCLAVLPIIQPEQTKAQILSGHRLPGEQRFQHVIPRTEEPLRYVIDSPLSRFAEAVSALKVAADLNGIVQKNKTIGITSSLPNEGKSTVASNFAQLIAHAGSRVLLIDLDLKKPSLSQTLAPDSRGLIDLLSERASFKEVVWVDRSTKLHFLPAGVTSKLLHTNEILASAALKKLLDSLRAYYDYVILDLAPLVPVVDVQATTNVIDTYVYVVEWGRTKIDVVERSLSRAPCVYDRILGVVLNKADVKRLGRYEGHHANYYWQAAEKPGSRGWWSVIGGICLIPLSRSENFLSRWKMKH
jgi:succinoglycan biosynthesis transport protein ExoP